MPSGRFLLRIDPGLHAALRRAAEEEGISLNDYCARKLAAPGAGMVGWQWAVEAIQRAATLFGSALVGVVVFGSWARAEFRADSDVDLLVVVDRRVRLTRKLYRRWDEAPLECEGRPVEPHFVHLPAAGRLHAGLWAEVAIDGVVLFTRGAELSARLVEMRRDIAEGRVVRRLVDGHPYWVEAA